MSGELNIGRIRSEYESDQNQIRIRAHQIPWDQGLIRLVGNYAWVVARVICAEISSTIRQCVVTCLTIRLSSLLKTTAFLVI